MGWAASADSVAESKQGGSRGGADGRYGERPKVDDGDAGTRDGEVGLEHNTSWDQLALLGFKLPTTEMSEDISIAGS